MIDTKALRSRVLDLAIQGKLTEQLESDGTAEELLPHGICNKSEENFSSGSVSFKLPSNWVSCYFEDINSFKSSTTNPLNSPKTLYELYSVPNYPLNKPEILRGESIGSSKQLLQENDILVCKINPRINRVWLVKRHTSYTIIGSSEWIPFRNNTINPQYLCYYFQAPFFRAFMESNLSGVGGSLTRAKPEFVKKYPVLLPPLAEQKRIVERVEDIFRVLDTIDEAQEKYSADVESLRSKLITAGIQGRLTQQLDTDGTAEELYQQIQAEKQKLIKEGKLKKEKPLPPISPEEIPFEIPGNWKWVRLGEICRSIMDGDHQPPPQTKEGIPFLVISNISNGVLDYSDTRHVSNEYFEKLSTERIAEKGDILFTVTGSFGIPVKVEKDIKFCFQRHIALLKVFQTINIDFLYHALLSQLIQKQCDVVAIGVAQRTVGIKSLRNMVVPLPPLAEQKRIADVLEKVIGVLK